MYLAERLNTIDDATLDTLQEGLGLRSITYGADVVDVPGQTRQGIFIRSGSKGEAATWHEQEDILFWQDDHWIVASN